LDNTNCCYFSYIQLIDRPKEPNFIKNATKNCDLLLSLKSGDILNIKGLGRIKIVSVNYTNYPGENGDQNTYIEIGLNCTRIGEAWSKATTVHVDSAIEEAEKRLATLNRRIDEDWEIQHALEMGFYIYD
jgi:hypothetical protein